MAGKGSQRKLLAAVVVGVAVLALPATGTAKRKPSGPRAPHPAAAKVVDRNHDKIFDDLEAKLDAAGPSAKLRAIVTLRGPVSDADVASLKAAAGSFAVSRSLPIIDGFATALTKGQVHTLARNGLVASIARDAPVHAFNADEQGAFGVTKAKLDDPALDGRNWFGPSPANVTVAVIDTGIDAGHQDLAGKVIGWNDLVNGQPTPYDDEGHGTHVSATIAGGAPQQTRLQDGVAPGSRLVGIKVLNSAGSGSTSTIIAGINWMVANKATYNIRVANMSLGASGCSNGVDPL